MICTSGYREADSLYDIPEKRTFAFSPSVCPQGSCDEIVATGTHWVALTAPCSQPSKCPSTFEFENLTTSAMRSDPTNATTRVELDSAGLVASVCRPLSVPRADETIEDGTYPGWGSLTFEGDNGIEAGRQGIFLQRCGSRRRTLLSRTAASVGCAARLCPPPSNRQVVIWQSAAGRLNGVFLNGFHRFQIIVPATVDPSAHQLRYVRADPYTLALAARTLYLETPGGTLWAAGLPGPMTRVG
jgi:hypothetical protein